jgi:hypothetical protein
MNHFILGELKAHVLSIVARISAEYPWKYVRNIATGGILADTSVLSKPECILPLIDDGVLFLEASPTGTILLRSIE